MKRAVGLAILGLAVGLAGAAAMAADVAPADPGSTRPPANLKKVGDHWTPWDSPAAKPEDYIIVPGDTLWSLGQQWLGDPYLWPQIWDQNRYILDSHWIYPGDPLTRPGAPTVVPPSGPPPGDAGAAAPVPTPAPAPGGAGGAVREPAAPNVLDMSRIAPLADESDVRCADYIVADYAPSTMWVIGRELEKVGVAEGDVIYLSQGRADGVVAGAEYAVVRNRRGVNHPASGDPLGRIMHRLGYVRVLCTQEESATAVIVDSCEPIEDSDEIVPLDPLEVPRVFDMPPFDRCLEPSGGHVGHVVSVKDDVDAAGTGHIIHADLGESFGILPGSFLTIYRERPELPRLLLGQAMVLTVEKGTCTAKVTSSVRELSVGDRVEVVR